MQQPDGLFYDDNVPADRGSGVHDIQSDKYVQKLWRVFYVREENRKVRILFSDACVQGKLPTHFHRRDRFPLRDHNPAGQRVQTVFFLQTIRRQQDHRIDVYDDVRAEHQHMRNGTGVRHALLLSVPKIPIDQRGHVRVEVEIDCQQPLPVGADTRTA